MNPVPRIRRGFRLQWEPAQACFVLLYPEGMDLCLKRVVEALDEMGGEALITADHGNCEQMTDPNSGQVHTAHTVGPVPLVYTGPRQVRLKDGGSLSDVAPSLLTLMGLEQPGEMTGHSLVELS